MQLHNEFRAPVAVPEAWKVLTDLERIAPLMPGAELEEVEGDQYRGVVRVKVGPIVAQYKGAVSFVETDEASGRVVLKASGRDLRGQGNASATITAVMTPDGQGTKMVFHSELTITGMVAQFGRGVMSEVSGKLMSQFADALEADLAREDGPAERTAGEADRAAAGEAESRAAGEAREVTAGRREPEPVDLLQVAGGSLVKRALPGLAALVLVLWGLRWRRRRGRSQRAS